MPPHYCQDEFIDACNRCGAVFPSGGALKGAADDFGLMTLQSLLDFIGNGGLENLTHDTTRALEKWPGPAAPPMVDSYTFSSGPKRGYIAFYKAPTGQWILKSFKKNMKEAELYAPFRDLQKRLEEKRKVEKKDE